MDNSPEIPEAPEQPQGLLWIKWAINHFRREWRVITKAPIATVTTVLILVFGIHFIDGMFFERQIDDLRSASEVYKATIDNLRNQNQNVKTEKSFISESQLQTIATEAIVPSGEKYRVRVVSFGTCDICGRTVDRLFDTLQNLPGWQAEWGNALGVRSPFNGIQFEVSDKGPTKAADTMERAFQKAGVPFTVRKGPQGANTEFFQIEVGLQ